MSRIKELPKSSSHLLSCTQIITSIHSVVKELIENSLDSSASNIEVILAEYGLEKIEVKDDGCGIHRDDINFVAKPHCTSKITSHLDLKKVETYGFRGEALSALSTVSDLEITTRTESDEFGLRYSFDSQGNVLSSKPWPCNRGTSVFISNIFKHLPVRKGLYNSLKAKKEEIRKIQDILIEFGSIQTGVRFVLHHNGSFIWQKTIVNKIIEGLQQTLGSVADYLENSEYVDKDTQIKISVFLPRKGSPLTCSSVTSNRSIVAVNNRPVRLKVIDKLLKGIFNKTMDGNSKARYPMCYVSIYVPPSEVDVNVEPNKTSVLMHNMDVVVEQFTKLLGTFYNVEITKETNGVPNNSHQTTAEYSNTEDSRSEILNESSSSISSFRNTLREIQRPPKPTIQLSSSFSKGKLSLNRKLSRSANSNNPPKKPRTSSDFSSPPNDIYRHINTMKNFFSTANNTTTEREMELTNSENNQSCRDECAPEKNVMIATIAGTDGQADGIQNIASDDHSNSSAASFDISFESSSEISHNATPSNQLTTSGTVIDDPPLKDSVANQNVPEKSSHVQDIQSVPCFNSNNWSRGIHPETSVKPVTVLRPEVTPNTQSSCGTPKMNVPLMNETSPNISPNQRKLTAFDIFCRKYRLEVASTNPDYSNPQIAQVLTEKWNRLNEEEKKIYRNLVPKDYPKNIKNKDKLGKVVEQNVNSLKAASKPAKKLRRTKKKLANKIIDFDLQKLMSSCSTCSEDDELDALKVINFLAPGIWICLQNSRLCLLNCFRLQEAIIYQRLLDTFIFQAETLTSPIILSASSLGSSGINILQQISDSEEIYVSGFISDERLVANGFQVHISRDPTDENDSQIKVTAIAAHISHYGIPDLKEILNFLQNKGPSTKLCDCRPGNAILFLQGEAMRMARQIPGCKNLEEVEDMLEKRKFLRTENCLHSKPIISEIYTINCD